MRLYRCPLKVVRSNQYGEEHKSNREIKFKIIRGGAWKDSNVNVVVRVALGTDCEGLKNSIMTFYRFRDKNLKKLMKKMKYFTKTNILCKLYIEYRAVA